MDTYIAVAGAVVLVALSGLFSGLNLGLMSFTSDDLGIVISGSDDPQEVAYARTIQPVRKHGNLLLCTLLLGNTLVNAVIAVLLSDLTSGLVGTITTTALIVVFGEIVPQSLCSRHALAIGAAALPLVQIFIAVCYPIAYPISILLDWLLGREVSAVFSRHGLLALVRLNVESDVHRVESGLTPADAKVLSGALTYQDRTVMDVMTPLEHVFALPLTARLSKETIVSILQRGHTRVPIYEDSPERIVALLFVKDLLGIGFEREIEISQIVDSFAARERVHRCGGATKLNEALEYCKHERVHLLVIVKGLAQGSSVSYSGSASPAAAEEVGVAEAAATGRSHIDAAIGIATMEDFIEEILQEEIVDETDVYVHNVSGGPSVGAMVQATKFVQKLSRVEDVHLSKALAKSFSRPELPKMNSRLYDMTKLLTSLPALPAVASTAVGLPAIEEEPRAAPPSRKLGGGIFGFGSTPRATPRSSRTTGPPGVPPGGTRSTSGSTVMH